MLLRYSNPIRRNKLSLSSLSSSSSSIFNTKFSTSTSTSTSTTASSPTTHKHHEILYRQEGKVGIVTLNAPSRLNSLTLPLAKELDTLLHKLDYTQIVRIKKKFVFIRT